MDHRPLFSIIIPTYNREKFLPKTIESVLKQSYSGFEAIIVDDGSTDGTEAAMAPYLSDKVLYFKKQNGERGAARNFGIERSQGEYITFVDSDDLLYPQHFEEAARMIRDNKRPPFFHLGYEIKTPEGTVVAQFNKRSGNLGEQVLFGNSLSCIGVFVRRDVMLQNLFREDRRMAGSEDWELWTRISSRFPLLYSNATTACMIDHDSRSVIHFDEKKLKTRIDLAVASLMADEPFINRFGHLIDEMKAHLNLYIAIHLAISHERKAAARYAWEAVRLHPLVMFSRKFAALAYRTIKG